MNDTMRLPLPAWAERALAAWIACFVYLQFVTSTFSIAATQFALAMLLLALVIVRAARPVEEWLPGWVVAPFVALFAVAVLSALLSSDPASFLVKITRDYRVFMVPFLVFFALHYADSRRLLQAFAVAVLLSSLYGVVQYFTGGDWLDINEPDVLGDLGGRFRAQGNLSNPMTYSGFLLVVSPLLVSLALGERSRWRWVWLAGGALAAGGVVASVTRSALIGWAAGMVVLGLRIHRRATLAVGGVLLVSGTVLAILVASGVRPDPETVEQWPAVFRRFGEVSLEHRGVRTRLYLWESALAGFRDRPWLGFAMNSHGAHLGPYQKRVAEDHGGFTYPVDYGASVHNVYLRMLFELGAIGLAVYLWLWGSILAWNAIWQSRAAGRLPWEHRVLWGATAGLAGSMVMGFFEDNFFDAEVQTLITMMMGLSLYMGTRVKRRLAAGDIGDAQRSGQPAHGSG